MPLAVRVVKRLMDISMSLFALIVLFPFYVWIAVFIWAEDHKSPIYKQKRCGIDGKEFTLYKFRTMVVDAEKETGVVLQTVGDSRVTKIGKLLRATRLDELPNFINVLLGQMSVVGPRAERPEIYKRLEGKFPMVWERTNLVKPGITGEAQLKLRSDGSLDEESEFTKQISYGDYHQPEDVVRFKMYYDFAYVIKLTSFWKFLITDLGIIIRTPYVMLWNRNVV